MNEPTAPPLRSLLIAGLVGGVVGGALKPVLEAAAFFLIDSEAMPLVTAVLFGAFGGITSAATTGIPTGLAAGLTVSLVSRFLPTANRTALWTITAVGVRLLASALGIWLMFSTSPSGDPLPRTIIAVTVGAALIAGVVAGVVSSRVESRV